MIEFLKTNYGEIIATVLVGAGFLVAMKTGFKTQASNILFYLVSKAESDFGSGTGKLKLEAVATWLYDKMPHIFKWFFTKKAIIDMIEAALINFKAWLEANQVAKEATQNAPKFLNI